MNGRREERNPTPKFGFINHRVSVDGCSHSRPNVKSHFDDTACSPDGSDAGREHENRPFTSRSGVNTLNDLIPAEGVVAV
jgi:hypothetical protein